MASTLARVGNEGKRTLRRARVEGHAGSWDKRQAYYMNRTAAEGRLLILETRFRTLGEAVEGFVRDRVHPLFSWNVCDRERHQIRSTGHLNRFHRSRHKFRLSHRSSCCSRTTAASSSVSSNSIALSSGIPPIADGPQNFPFPSGKFAARQPCRNLDGIRPNNTRVNISKIKKSCKV